MHIQKSKQLGTASSSGSLQVFIGAKSNRLERTGFILRMCSILLRCNLWMVQQQLQLVRSIWLNLWTHTIYTFSFQFQNKERTAMLKGYCNRSKRSVVKWLSRATEPGSESRNQPYKSLSSFYYFIHINFLFRSPVCPWIKYRPGCLKVNYPVKISDEWN